jgi:hypothetical protein
LIGIGVLLLFALEGFDLDCHFDLNVIRPSKPPLDLPVKLA